LLGFLYMSRHRDDRRGVDGEILAKVTGRMVGEGGARAICGHYRWFVRTVCASSEQKNRGLLDGMRCSSRRQPPNLWHCLA